MGKLDADYPDLEQLSDRRPDRVLFLHVSLAGGIYVWTRVIYDESTERIGLLSREAAERLAALYPDKELWLSKVIYTLGRPLSAKAVSALQNLKQVQIRAKQRKRELNEFTSQSGQGCI